MLLLHSSVCLFGGEAEFNFDTDPTGELTIISDQADVVWQETGGQSGGYLSITEAVGSIGTKIIFPDLDDGKPVGAFRFEMAVRMGNGITDRPADGFSISYAREGDPALENATAQGGFTPAAENGTGTGIAIGFDAWQGNQLPDGEDIEGIIVRVDNVTVLRQPLPTRHGECEDPTSLQTGPQDPADNRTGSADNLCWQPLTVELNLDAQLTVTWKGETILDHFQTQYFTSPGRLIMAGRTGGSNQNHHVDELKISTTPVEKFIVGPIEAGSLLSGFSFGILDAFPESIFDPDSLEMTLDGESIEPTSMTKNGSITTVTYSIAPEIWPSGSEHTLEIVAADMNGDLAVLQPRTFMTVPYSNLSPLLAVDDVDTSAPGFRVRPYATNEDQPNTVQWTEEQLAGEHGENLALLQNAGPDVDNDGILDFVVADSEGYYDETSVINYNQDLNAAGSFSSNDVEDSEWHFDRFIPGTPGPQTRDVETENDAFGTVNFSLEILTYLEFAETGVYGMGVNSDDGFKVSDSHNPNHLLSSTIGIFDGGRGAEDSVFYFNVVEPGFYPFRLIWFNGAGGASVEWFIERPDGTRYLINDPNISDSVKAYRTATVSTPAYASSANPAPDSTGFELGADIVIELTDADSQVDDASVMLSVNGEPQTPMVAKSGGVTTVTLSSSGLLSPGSLNSIELSYMAGGRLVSGSWSFTAAGQPPYNIVQAHNPIEGSSDNTPGNETVDRAIDGDSTTKYLNFDAGAADGNLPTGLTVWTVSSVVNGLYLTSANDAPGRDPATYELYGSFEGGEFELISEGDVPAFADRFTTVSILFENELVYDAYQIVFPTITDPGQNSMQIAEVELYGLPVASDVSMPSSPVVGSSDNTPAAEIPALAIDNDSATKYLNFDAGAENGNLPTGLTVTTGNSLVTGLALTSANDAPERDPATYELWGSIQDGEFELIAEGYPFTGNFAIFLVKSILTANPR